MPDTLWHEDITVAPIDRNTQKAEQKYNAITLVIHSWVLENASGRVPKDSFSKDVSL